MKLFSKRPVLLAGFLICLLLEVAGECDDTPQEERTGPDNAGEGSTLPPCPKTDVGKTEKSSEEATTEPPLSAAKDRKKKHKGRKNKYSSITVGDTTTDSNSSTTYFHHQTNERSQTRWTHFSSPNASPSSPGNDGKNDASQQLGPGAHPPPMGAMPMNMPVGPGIPNGLMFNGGR